MDAQHNDTIIKEAVAFAETWQNRANELLHYFREQSICFNYHRYGNLGERALT